MFTLVLGAALLEAGSCPPPVAEQHRREGLACFGAGLQALEAGQWEVADRHLAAAVALDPLQPLAHYGRGQAAIERHRYEEAVEAFGSSREAFRCLVRAAGEATGLAQVGEAVREMRESLRRLEQERLVTGSMRWREINRDVPPTKGEGLRQIQELERRLWELEEWRRRGTDAPLGVSLALGTAYFHAGSLAEAEREFRAVLAADPKNGDAHNNLAVVLMLTGRPDDAEREVALAKKAGVNVNPRLKEEIRKRKEANR